MTTVNTTRQQLSATTAQLEAAGWRVVSTTRQGNRYRLTVECVG